MPGNHKRRELFTVLSKLAVEVWVLTTIRKIGRLYERNNFLLPKPSVCAQGSDPALLNVV